MPYLLSPRLAEGWFAPNNGAFLYNPLLLLVAYNRRLSMHFDGYFYGKRDGDWPAYQTLLK